MLDELAVRRAAMAYLADQSRGIRNPRQLVATLSILSQPKGPYDDIETQDRLLRYACRDGDPDGGDNRKLRRAAELGPPLLLLQVVTNGLSLCKIHHAAYDRGIVGVRSDYVVQVRDDVLLEIDGPMLEHGIQAVHDLRLELPSRAADRPDRDLLARRYAVFNR